MRKTFADVLKSGGVDIEKEYLRLLRSFYDNRIGLSNQCAGYFMQMPFRGTCVSLEDFDAVYGFNFSPSPKNFDTDYLINFCEYSYNLIINLPEDYGAYEYGGINSKESYIQQVERVVEKINCEIIYNDDGIAIIIPKNSVANVVSEILPENLSYKVIAYNHHSMKGGLDKKQATIKLLADQLEAKKDKLSELNNSLKSDLFYLFNNINIRHNNIDSSSKSYKKAVAEMSKEELEEWYDRTYDMCLMAFMVLEQADNKTKIKELKDIIENSKK